MSDIKTIDREELEAKLDRGDDFVRLTRKATGIPTPPIYLKQGFDGPMDQTKIMTFAPPPFVLIELTSADTGLPK